MLVVISKYILYNLVVIKHKEIHNMTVNEVIRKYDLKNAGIAFRNTIGNVVSVNDVTANTEVKSVNINVRSNTCTITIIK